MAVDDLVLGEDLGQPGAPIDLDPLPDLAGAVLLWRQSGEQRGQARGGPRKRHRGVGEHDARVAQGVDVRGVDKFSAIATKKIGSELIWKKKHNIWMSITLKWGGITNGILPLIMTFLKC